jgi:hypothetical protein
MVLQATLVTYTISSIINFVYLYFDIKGSKTKTTLSDYFLLFIPIVNTIVSVSIIIIEVLLIAHSIDWGKFSNKKNNN